LRARYNDYTKIIDKYSKTEFSDIRKCIAFSNKMRVQKQDQGLKNDQLQTKKSSESEKTPEKEF